MADYRFVTTWRLHAPIDAVFAVIDDAGAWPSWWPNVRAPMPFVEAIFRLNHHAVMRRGLQGIRLRLGGVAGTYTREDRGSPA